ncbi:sporulation protein [Streptomyces sp. JJ66]|uniref:sporulation protein n=1 Tax=Streptomyces sp. JJ66 TaxID=2803843 RepID=UPI001C55DCAB|nr:sporulation protein [Streptomyces sp. JJ66]MBW1602327.1 sporulation protein [Streptomyces sp. JJ66]
MVFKRLLGSLGMGGPTVDTVLEAGPALPGGELRGEVRMRGGGTDYEIEQVELELVARVEAEHEEGEEHGIVGFARFTVGGGFRLTEEAEESVPFAVPLPWETPLTELHGQPLGIALGLRTALHVAGARDQGDLDPIAVAPLPAQEAVLEALGQLGFGFTSADVELGHIHGTGQQLPFYQELELAPAPRFAHALHQLEVTFLAAPGGVEVVLEGDKRSSGLFGGSTDVLHRHVIAHEDVARRDWVAEVDSWVSALAEHHAGPGHPVQHGGTHHSGLGAGAVGMGAVGLAAGVAGGLVAAEIVDEIGDAFEDDEAEDGEAGDED